MVKCGVLGGSGAKESIVVFGGVVLDCGGGPLVCYGLLWWQWCGVLCFTWW